MAPKQTSLFRPLLIPANSSSRLNRRRFLYSASAVLFAGPALLRGQGLNEKLDIAMIGLGGKSGDNLKGLASENIVALCEVDGSSLDRVGAQYPAARRHRDFRRMFDEQKDIDAVVVTTPDHIHAVASMMAMKLGKHVYCEKPLTHSVYEARQMANTARESKVATQMGNGGHASDTLREAVDWLRGGVIGPVREVHCWSNRPIWPQGIERPLEMPPVPKNLDWDLWLGPAPSRPYNPAYHPFKWRGFWDFGTGALGDMGCHIIDTAFWALELGAPSAVEAESSGVNPETAPKWSIVRYEFPARGERPPVKLTWYDGGKQPSRELTEVSADEKLSDNGSLFIGAKGKLLFQRERGKRLFPQPKDFEPPPRVVPRSPGHYVEWIQACKGGAAALSNFDYAGALTEMVLLGNVALRAGRRIEWNSEKLEVRNAPESAQLIRREYRQGWTL
jgi:predicted dehydrogenase